MPTRMPSPIVVVGVALAILFLVWVVACFAFLAYRQLQWRRRGSQVWKRLPFHLGGPKEEVPRALQHCAVVFPATGALLVDSWDGMMCVCLALVVSIPVGAHRSQQVSWDEVFGPWVVLSGITCMAASFTMAFRPQLMILFAVPAEDVTDGTHVVIEEAPRSSSAASAEDHGQGPSADGLFSLCAGISEHREILPIRVDQGPQGSKDLDVFYFNYSCLRYSCCSPCDRFTPRATCTPSRGLRPGNTSGWARACTGLHGPNMVRVPVPSVLEAIGTELCDCRYHIAMLGSWAQVAQQAWATGISWLLLSAACAVYQAICIRRGSQLRISELAKLQETCTVRRNGVWVQLDASEVVIFDVVSVAEGKVVADGTIIDGSVVADESVLTGEAVPMIKYASRETFLYAGTTVLQTSGRNMGKAVMLVTAIGGATARGVLIRQAIISSKAPARFDDQMPKVYAFLSGYAGLLAALYLFSVTHASLAVKCCTALITTAAVINPMMPTSIAAGQSAVHSRLRKLHKIACLNQSVIPVAGKVAQVVLDKTGTITDDGMELEFVVAIVDGEITAEVKLPSAGQGTAPHTILGGGKIPRALSAGLACAPSVSRLEDGALVGSRLEISMLAASGWSMDKNIVTSHDRMQTLTIVRRLPFDHDHRTSGVIVRDWLENRYDVYLKGPCERLGGLAVQSSVPSEFNTTVESLSRDGHYVLAVAKRTLVADSDDEILALSRKKIERNITLVGIVAFKNEIEAFSPGAVRVLEEACIPCVMCTGDSLLASVPVAQRCGIIAGGQRVLVGEASFAAGEAPIVQWSDPEDRRQRVVDPQEIEHRESLLAVTGPAWRVLRADELELWQLLPRIKVFGRMRPQDKVDLVRHYQGQGLCVGFCGDGGSDCRALAAANVGLAFSDSEVSLVSAFSVPREGRSLNTMVDLIREGRACLAANLGGFIFWAVHAVLTSSLRVLQDVRGGGLPGQAAWIFIDVVIGVAFGLAATRSAAVPELALRRPTKSLLGPRTVLTIAFSVAAGWCTFGMANLVLWGQSWYQEVNAVTDLGQDAHCLPCRSDTYSGPVAAFAMAMTLANVAYSSTYGGLFRQTVLRNFWLNVSFAVVVAGACFLLFAAPTTLHALFRINCDTASSLRGAGALQWLAMGEDGAGCVLGPQLRDWNVAFRGFRPSAADKCAPPANFSAVDQPRWPGCEGANNCYGVGFRVELAAILIVSSVIIHFSVRLLLTRGPGDYGEFWREGDWSNLLPSFLRKRVLKDGFKPERDNWDDDDMMVPVMSLEMITGAVVGLGDND